VSSRTGVTQGEVTFNGFSGRGDSRAAAIAESDGLRDCRPEWMH